MLCMRDSQQLKLALELVAFAERDIQLAPQFVALAERDIQLAPQLVAFTVRLAQLAPDLVAFSLGMVSLAQIFVTLAQSDVSAGLDQALELRRICHGPCPMTIIYRCFPDRRKDLACPRQRSRRAPGNWPTLQIFLLTWACSCAQLDCNLV